MKSHSTQVSAIRLLNLVKVARQFLITKKVGECFSKKELRVFITKTNPELIGSDADATTLYAELIRRNMVSHFKSPFSARQNFMLVKLPVTPKNIMVSAPVTALKPIKKPVGRPRKNPAVAPVAVAPKNTDGTLKRIKHTTQSTANTSVDGLTRLKYCITHITNQLDGQRERLKNIEAALKAILDAFEIKVGE